MASFTIHSIDLRLDDRLTERARHAGLSKNQLIKNLLAHATGLPVEGQGLDDYQEFCGIWTDEERQEFLNSQADNERVDMSDWQQ